MKVQIGENIIHARVFVPLPHTGESPELHSIQKDHTNDSELQYF